MSRKYRWVTIIANLPLHIPTYLYPCYTHPPLLISHSPFSHLHKNSLLIPYTHPTHILLTSYTHHSLWTHPDALLISHSPFSHLHKNPLLLPHSPLTHLPLTHYWYPLTPYSSSTHAFMSPTQPLPIHHSLFNHPPHTPYSSCNPILHIPPTIIHQQSML